MNLYDHLAVELVHYMSPANLCTNCLVCVCGNCTPNLNQEVSKERCGQLTGDCVLGHRRHQRPDEPVLRLPLSDFQLK